MAPLHHVYFLGTVIQAPAVWAAPNGTAVARWSLAVPTRRRQGDTGHADVCRIEVLACGRQAATRRGHAPPRLHGPDRRARPVVADGAGQPIAPHPGGDRRAHPVSVLPPADPVCRHGRWRGPGMVRGGSVARPSPRCCPGKAVARGAMAGVRQYQGGGAARDAPAQDAPGRGGERDGGTRISPRCQGIYMKLSVDSLHQCDGFVLFCQTFSEDLSRGVSFS